MSTSTLDRPALRAVFTPRDAEEVADYLARGRQRRRWGRFLTAKNALLSLIGKARRFATRVIEQYRLGGAVQAVKTTLGWLAWVGCATTSLLSAGLCSRKPAR